MRLDVDLSQTILPPPVAEHVTYSPEPDEVKSKELLNQGIKFAQAGDRAAARTALLTAAKHDPECESAWLWLASISEYPEELMAFLDNVLAINAENKRALQWKAATEGLLSKTFVQRGMDAAEADQAMYAEDCFRKALEYDKQNASAWLALASISEDETERVECLARVLEIEPENPAAANALKTISEQRLSSQFEEIRNAASNGQTDRALQLLGSFTKENPNHVEGWMLLSHIAATPADKLAALARVLEIDPEHQAALVTFESLNALFAVPETKTVVVLPEPTPISDEPEPISASAETEQTTVYVEPEMKSASSEPEPISMSADLVAAELPVAPDDLVFEAPIPEPTMMAFEPEYSASPEFDPFSTSVNISIPVAESFQDEVPQVAAASEELVFEPLEASSPVDLNALFETPESDLEIMEPDWDRETASYESMDLVGESDAAKPTAVEVDDSIEAAFAIPMPEELPFDEAAAANQRTGFETRIEHAVAEQAVESACPYCSANLADSPVMCNSCFAALTLSDLEMLINNNNVDRYTVRKAVEKMEAERGSRELNEVELTALGIGHLNLRNLQYGYNYLLEASKLNPDNIVLSSELHSLLIRMDELKRQDELHATMTKGKRILVVDDSATIRKLIAGKLEKSGHEVYLSSDGVEAMEQLKELIPDLILLDITMPRMDGYEVCRQIRGHNLTSHIPVVMISGKDGFFDKVRGRMAGTTGYITKPFGPETLMKAIEYYLGGGEGNDGEAEAAEMIH
ncbi:MAG: response regulator [Pyrinomonadaceae bacterium]